MIPQKITLVTQVDDLINLIERCIGSKDKLCVIDDVSQLRKSDIVLLHHDFPLHSRLELIPSIIHKYPTVAIIVIGLSAAPFDIAEAFRLGARDYLFQPIQKEIFVNALYRQQLNQTSEVSDGWWHQAKKWISGLRDQPLFLMPPGNRMVQMEDVTLAAPPDLEVQFFGSLSLRFRRKTLPKMPGKKTNALLAYLLYHYPKPVHRDVLMDKFWGDATTDSARNCLNVTLHTIRKNFEQTAGREEIICFEQESYRISEALKVERDIDLFTSYWRKGQQLEQLEGIQAANNVYHQAFAFYQGDLLEELRFEDWVFALREKYREIWLVILDRLSIHFYQNGKYQISKNLCQRMVEKDPCLEEVHRRIMDCYARLKMPDMAIRQFHKCRDILKKELNVTPGRATWDLFLHIRDA